LKKESRRGKKANRAATDDGITLATDDCRHEDSQPSPPPIQPHAGWRQLGGVGHDSRRLFFCNLPPFLVPSSLLSVVLARLNLLPTTVNKISKNPKYYMLLYELKIGGRGM